MFSDIIFLKAEANMCLGIGAIIVDFPSCSGYHSGVGDKRRIPVSTQTLKRQKLFYLT